MDYLCSECSTQLNKFEIELNTLYPVGRLYCEFCQNKHERQLIEKLKKSFENDLDIYDFNKKLRRLSYNIRPENEEFKSREYKRK